MLASFGMANCNWLLTTSYCLEITGSCSFEPKNCKALKCQQFYISPAGFRMTFLSSKFCQLLSIMDNMSKETSYGV